CAQPTRGNRESPHPAAAYSQLRERSSCRSQYGRGSIGRLPPKRYESAHLVIPDAKTRDTCVAERKTFLPPAEQTRPPSATSVSARLSVRADLLPGQRTADTGDADSASVAVAITVRGFATSSLSTQSTIGRLSTSPSVLPSAPRLGILSFRSCRTTR